MRNTLLFLVALSLGASSCKETKNTHVGQDAGLQCGENERILNGECVFVCDRDGDCPAGQVCNLFTGACEQGEEQPDASVAAPCTTGAKRCALDNKSLEECDTDGAWQTLEACPAPNGFCLNQQCLACQPGVATCSGTSTANMCLDDGSGTRPITCGGGTSCQQGECRECDPNSTRCSPDGKALQLCTRTGNESAMWTWTNNGDAFDGTCITQVCETTPSVRCRPPACFPGATQCASTTTQQVCSATGNWNNVVCSSLPGFSASAECQGGTCVDECGDAAKAKSYFGCEYWSAVPDNSVDRFFKGGTTTGQGSTDSDFAFVVTNRSELQANVTVYRWFGNAEVVVKTVPVPGRNDPTTKGLMTVYVPWQSIGPTTNPVGVGSTGKEYYGYRLTSTRPVSVYQFSPLPSVKVTSTVCTENEGLPDAACKGSLTNCCGYSDNSFECTLGLYPSCPGVCKAAAGTKKCHYYSYSNDASLLLPAHILGTSHVVVSQEHYSFADNASQAPSGNTTGTVTIVGTQNGTTVTFKSSARTLAGGGLAAMNKGDTANFTLNRYEVLQFATANLGTGGVGVGYIECADNPFDSNLFGNKTKICRVDSDLTGSVITSSAPVAVFGGSPCVTKPYNRVACDHIEEQIFPFATWGKNFLAQKSHPLRLRNQSFSTSSPPDHYKIVSGCPAATCPNGTLITLSPAPTSSTLTEMLPNRCAAGTSLLANNCRLVGATHIEFRSGANFLITADNPVAVAQFFSGQGPVAWPLPSTTEPEQGDPSMVLLPPIEQWRSQYTLLAAPGIKDNYLGISIDASKVQSVEVDGVSVPLTGFTALAGSPTGTDYRMKNHPISVGTHTLTVTPKAGVTVVPGAGVIVYGYDQFVSYGYTGGLDLQSIVTDINPGG